jgi:hypothetical protein
MNVMNRTYDIKNSILQNVAQAAVRVSCASSYSFGTQPDVSQESPGSVIFNIRIGSVFSCFCLVAVSIKNAVDCERFQSASYAILS